MRNPNVNCLEKKKCPRCGSYGPFDVYVSAWARLSDDGSDFSEAGDGHVEYNDDSEVWCRKCGKTGLFGEFDDHPDVRDGDLSDLGEYHGEEDRVGEDRAVSEGDV